MIPTVIPIVHLNGDRKETLTRTLEQAYRALRAAEGAVQQCAGNARNFYPDPGRWEQYCAQHRARLAHLRAVMESLIAEVEGLNEAYPTRRPHAQQR